MQDNEELERLVKLIGDEKLAKEFLAFKNKERLRVTRKEIEAECKRLIENDFLEEYEIALEEVNKVYRKAWSKACKNLGYSEEEFPSKY